MTGRTCGGSLTGAGDTTARGRDINYAGTFLGILLVLAFCALIYFGRGCFDHPLWRNLYLSSSDGDVILIVWFMIVANHLNNASGRPPRIWLSAAGGLIGLVAIAFAASQATAFVPDFNLCAGLYVLMMGGTVVALGRDGVLVQVWRNLFTKGLDYGERLFPVAGFVICMALLGFWGWGVWDRYNARDHSVIPEVACFGLGAVLAVLAGKRVVKPVAVAAVV